MNQTIAQFLDIKDFPFEIKNKRGNKVYSEDSDGHWFKTKYDENGNELYFESSNGYWYKRKYDEDGNEICYESSSYDNIKDSRPKNSCNNTIVEITKYDENGNNIYYNTSKGYWIKREYDENNNEIYYEDSDGRIVNHRPYKSKNSCNNKVVEIEGKKYKLKEIK